MIVGSIDNEKSSCTSLTTVLKIFSNTCNENLNNNIAKLWDLNAIGIKYCESGEDKSSNLA